MTLKRPWALTGADIDARQLAGIDEPVDARLVDVHRGGSLEHGQVFLGNLRHSHDSMSCHRWY
jgi:hypothetical protein